MAVDTIDEWRARHWGQPGACPCGDPIILADTEDWPVPLCFDCWHERKQKEARLVAEVDEAI
jgi:hypothetical protein